ncbi:MAG: DEAD/DEAH box helicase [Victivallales bacterium]|nr:DEAD/DEAH box helicase [Victivallales bacterium]
MVFKKLGLMPEIADAVKGYENITPVQEQAIPAILAGHDVLGKSRTGTGKTAAFVLPVLQLLAASAKPVSPCPPRALILVPTRELAGQIENCICNYGRNLELKSLSIFGGVPVRGQVKALSRDIDILTATPGRLLEFVEQQTADLSAVEILILDEADRMLAMGFIREVEKLIGYLPAKRQNLLFAATEGKEINKFISQQLTNPVVIEARQGKTVADKVKQLVYFVPPERKRDLLAHLIRQNDWRQALVFTRTKGTAGTLARQLNDCGINTAVIHADKSQNARIRALKEFTTGTFRVLTATDIAARGLDIKNLPCVINYELPNTPKIYVHRIGRTGRAGAEGTAVSLVAGNEKGFLKKIETFLNWNIKRKTAASYPRLGRPEEYRKTGQRQRRK